MIFPFSSPQFLFFLKHLSFSLEYFYLYKQAILFFLIKRILSDKSHEVLLLTKLLVNELEFH